ncbi:hypothetical protein DM02DRAFT_662574 [Periconia macrospinosa]|uniref:Vacuolar ATPase assembly protein VMA22 n=1 Tax=Periconia macrospinosa TaxID=97972 RepID=A0A2V1D6Q6_9PLEO|nr:hypothetical protein DM02DRAFT_662574 [Periconia macrospinosa]
MATAENETLPEKMENEPSKKDLSQKLDELLEQYLRTVDAYQQAQLKLTSQLSSGYIALAQANFSNPSGPRYGRDYYDDRMTASRQVTLTDKGPNVTFSVDVFAPPEQPNRTTGEPNLEATLDHKSTRTHPSTVPAGFETATRPKDEPIGRSLENVLEQDHVVPPPPRDPLRWFGILVPSALRSAQSYFVSAVEGPLSQIANLSKELRQQEMEIGRLRKQLKKL